MVDIAYAESRFRAPEIRHGYGPQVHLLDDPFYRFLDDLQNLYGLLHYFHNRLLHNLLYDLLDDLLHGRSV